MIIVTLPTSVAEVRFGAAWNVSAKSSPTIVAAATISSEVDATIFPSELDSSLRCDETVSIMTVQLQMVSVGVKDMTVQRW